MATTPTDPTPTPETTVHPDDSLFVNAISVQWSGNEPSDALLRLDKAVLNGDEPRTRYTYGLSKSDSKKVLVSIPHGDPPLEVAIDDGGVTKTLQLTGKTVHADAKRPQVWYTYGLEGSELTVKVHRYL